MAGHLAWFKMYAAETLSDERFSGWTVEERGAWFTLILHAWREGSIPSDQTSLARLCHVDAAAMRGLWSAIGDRFAEHPDYPGRLSSPRLEMEREAGQKMLARKSEAGKAGATSRWDKKNKRHSSRMAAASEPNADPMRNDGASGQHSAAKPQGSSSNASPPLPTREQLLARQAPRSQELLDALAAAGRHLTHAKPDKRDTLEDALKGPGAVEAAARHILADLEERDRRRAEIPGSLGFFVGDLTALAARSRIALVEDPPPRPLAIIDLAWMGQLPPERRAQAQAKWEALEVDIESRMKPEAAQRALAGSAEMLRQEFTS